VRDSIEVPCSGWIADKEFDSAEYSTFVSRMKNAAPSMYLRIEHGEGRGARRGTRIKLSDLTWDQLFEVLDALTVFGEAHHLGGFQATNS
jgi:hypothetical protein